MWGDILEKILWSPVSQIHLWFEGTFRSLVPSICSLLGEWKPTRRNVILRSVIRLFVPPIYRWTCEGYTDEDRRYAFLFLVMEIVSFILDLKGGSHWGYLLASCLLSVWILDITICAYFIRRSRIELQDRKLICQEIVFSVIQLFFSCYCLIKTLSGDKTNYNSSWFPLASAVISFLFSLKSKNDVSQSSSDTRPDDPPNESVSIPMPTGDAKADPLDKSLDSVHKSDDKEDPLDKSFVYVPSTSASVPQTTTLRRRGKQSHFQVDPLNPTLDSASTSSSVVFNLRSKKNVSHSSVDTPPDSPSNQFVLVSAPTSDAEVDPWDEPLVSVPTSDAQVDPLDEPCVSVPTSDAQVDPLDEPLVSVPTSDAQVDPLDEPRVSVPTSDASIPQANTLRRCSEQSHFKKVVFRVELIDDKAKKKAMRTVSRISGIDSMQVDMKEQKLTVTGNIDPVQIATKLRKQYGCTEIISVGPAKQTKASEEKQSVEKKNLLADPHPREGRYIAFNEPPRRFGREGPKGCVIS